MKVAGLNEDQKKMLLDADLAGVEVQYLLCEREGGDEDDYMAHKQAALLTLEKIKNDFDEYFSRLLLDAKYKNKKRSDFYQVSIDAEKIDGNSVSLQQFLGKYYSVDKNICAHRGRSSQFLNNYFWFGDAELPNNVLDTTKAFECQELGYVYAFFEPPYSIRGSTKEKEALFRKLETLFFGGFDSRAKIFKWSDNCSNYFDAGKEWWGTYFYTYAAPASKLGPVNSNLFTPVVRIKRLV